MFLLKLFVVIIFVDVIVVAAELALLCPLLVLTSWFSRKRGS